jgi:flagellar basal-body rod protein FlgC
MSFDNILEISRLALGNEKLRAEIASMNIARANTPSAASNKDAVGFSESMRNVGAQKTFSATGDSVSNLNSSNTILVADSSQSNYGSRMVYEPKNSLANASGFVAYPDIDLATEFVKLTLAKRAYEANVRVFNTVSGMHSKTLELGRV